MQLPVFVTILMHCTTVYICCTVKACLVLDS